MPVTVPSDTPAPLTTATVMPTLLPTPMLELTVPMLLESVMLRASPKSMEPTVPLTHIPMPPMVLLTVVMLLVIPVMLATPMPLTISVK